MTAPGALAQSEVDGTHSYDRDECGFRVDENTGELILILPPWIQDNRIPENEWAHDHRVATRLIDAAPLPFPISDPVALIRAVNHLHSMGKSDAIRVLRDYAAKHYHGNDWRLEAIVPLLFAPIDFQEVLPPHPWFDPKQTSWCLQCLVLEGDIPFNVFEGFTLGGYVEPTAPLVEWAARYGKLRENPLRPSADPWGAADRVFRRMTANDGPLERTFGSRAMYREYRNELRQRLRKQASMAAHHSEASQDPSRAPTDYLYVKPVSLGFPRHSK